MSSRTERLFLAIDLPDTVMREAERIHRIIDHSQEYKAVRTVPVQNMHLTLHFLGDIEVSRHDELAEAVESVIAVSAPVSIAAGHCGFFERGGLPAVFWLGCRADQGLHDLYTATAHVLRAEGVQLEKRPYSPHITLGYARRNADAADLVQSAGALSRLETAECSGVSAMVYLVKSRVQHGGAVHEKIESFQLVQT